MHRVFLAALLVSAPALAVPKVTPGQWQATTTIESATMPGMPPQALAMMKNRPTTVTYCLTPQDVEADPKKMLAADKSCKVNRMLFQGGRIDAQMAARPIRARQSSP